MLHTSYLVCKQPIKRQTPFHSATSNCKVGGKEWSHSKDVITKEEFEMICRCVITGNSVPKRHGKPLQSRINPVKSIKQGMKMVNNFQHPIFCFNLFLSYGFELEKLRF
ncbi:hypothetical protein AMECASPLE_039403 [Ameca splendens]|uniref:Uncharacterized protein n=1 Tax=Ameca splendens TaxID=208324 RepID=A0ABV0ZH79_9TELE